MSKANYRDKIGANVPTSGSFGSSTSANLTVSSSGQFNNDSSSLFPEYKQSEHWKSHTDVAVEKAPVRKND